MGLAGNKVKQRLSSDPNNLNWSNDQSKFGFRMLQKMGWAPGKGLGVNEDGNKEHVKIRLKEDSLGLGANKKTTENWLGNTDAFSQLLADLNTRSEESTSPQSENDNEEKDGSKKKRKRSSSDDKDDVEHVDKKKKKDRKDKKEKKEKKEKKDKSDKKKDKKKDKKDKEDGASPSSAEKAPTVLRNAARAKFLRAKRMATQHDPARLNEILGIKA